MGQDINEEEFSEQDLELIQKLAETKEIFYILVKSMCPTIYGHEIMKAGILLAIVGGSNISTTQTTDNVFQK